jgi:hypothetical protein
MDQTCHVVGSGLKLQVDDVQAILMNPAGNGTEHGAVPVGDGGGDVYAIAYF